MNDRTAGFLPLSQSRTDHQRAGCRQYRDVFDPEEVPSARKRSKGDGSGRAPEPEHHQKRRVFAVEAVCAFAEHERSFEDNLVSLAQLQFSGADDQCSLAEFRLPVQKLCGSLARLQRPFAQL